MTVLRRLFSFSMIWRIGLMGHGATVRNVDLVLTALREVLKAA